MGIKGRGRSGTSRDSNPACLCCSSAHLVQCEPDEASGFTNPNVSPGTYASLRLKLDAWSSAVQRGQKCSSPTRRLPSRSWGPIRPRVCSWFRAPIRHECQTAQCHIFVAASHQTRLDTRSKARRPIKVGIEGRGRSGTSRDSNPACLCCSSAHLVQCEPDEASSFTNPNVDPGTYASLRLKLDAWSSAVQRGQKCSSPTRRLPSRSWGPIRPRVCSWFRAPIRHECQTAQCHIFVAASHQTRLDTRSKARRPIKVGIKGRGRSGRSRDSNPACQCCSSAHLVQCEPDEASGFTNPNVGPGTYASLRLKLDAWSSAVQRGQKCSSPTRRLPSRSWGPIRPRVCSWFRAPIRHECQTAQCHIFVAASHQTRLDTRSKARRPIKVGIKGRGRSGRSRDSNPACLCCSSAHLVQCEPDEASSFTNPNVSPGTYASLRLKLDAWSSAVQRGQKCSSPTRRLPSRSWGPIRPRVYSWFRAPIRHECQTAQCQRGLKRACWYYEGAVTHSSSRVDIKFFDKKSV